MGRRRGKPGQEDLGDVKLSKKLATLLRHRAVANDLSIRPDGFVPVAEILRLPNFSTVGVDDLRRIVDTDMKYRFCFSPDGTLLRANQGHTMDVIQDDALLRRLGVEDCDVLEVCLHGTYHSCLPAILKDGLRRMARRNVHFAAGLPGETGVISGMRGSADVLIYVDLRRAIEDGVPFYISDNRVILSPGIFWKGNDGVVPPAYFAEVVDRRTGNDLA